jgi:hypothetical protein
MYTELKWQKDYNDEIHGISCKINGLPSYVTKTTQNKDYVEIMKQVEAGTLTIEDAD